MVDSFLVESLGLVQDTKFLKFLPERLLNEVLRLFYHAKVNPANVG